jgi:hypothetical protein
MPDNLKAGMENLSGMDISDVRVHYNSDKPAELGALAYTQRTNIHIAPGQEKHLPHEAWHVFQQAHGRVRPTILLKDMTVNDDEGLEREADEMGEKVKNYEKNVNDSGRTILKQSKSLRSSELIIQHSLGIDEPTHMMSFIANMSQLKRNWGILYEKQRLDSIFVLINEELKPSPPCTITSGEISSAAELIQSGVTAQDALRIQISSKLNIPEMIASYAALMPLKLQNLTAQEISDLNAVKEWKDEFTNPTKKAKYKNVVSN